MDKVKIPLSFKLLSFQYFAKGTKR
uniref:Uncharacterized protein n=1 Tax=Arundo donax TaxID=35708 RepID=A0A0A8XWA3_ARUDO